MIQVPVRALAAALPFIAKKDRRSVLLGAEIDDGYLVAANGPALVVIEDTGLPADGRYWIPRKLVQEATRSGQESVEFEFGEHVALHTKKGVTYGSTHTGPSLDWRSLFTHILPDSEAPPRLGPEPARALAEMLKALHGYGHAVPSARVWAETPEHRMLFQVHRPPAGMTVYGVLASVRDLSDLSDPRKWLAKVCA